MLQTLINNWWLLALCGVLQAISSVTNLLMRDPAGSPILRRFAGVPTVRYMGTLALAAGVCTIAASICGSTKRRSWLIALNGLALTAFGLIGMFWDIRRRLSFFPVALLFVVMALSIGVFALATALTLRRHVFVRWWLDSAGTVSVGFAVGFLVVGFGWIRLEPTGFWLWMSTYFGFSAIFMLGLGLRLNGLRTAIHRIAGSTLPVG